MSAAEKDAREAVAFNKRVAAEFERMCKRMGAAPVIACTLVSGSFQPVFELSFRKVPKS